MRHERLNTKMQLEQRITPPHDLADTAEEWQVVTSIWGHIASQSGREYRESDQMHAQRKHVIYTHYYKDAAPLMRLRAGNRLFEVESVYPMNGQRFRTQWNVVEVV